MSAPQVLTMGTFDGVHRGHRTIIVKTVEMARRKSCRSLAVTFSQPPRLYFFPQKGASLLTLPLEKVALLRSLGIDQVVVLPFGAALAGLSAADFFEKYFLKRFQAQDIVVGYDFGFGRQRQGDTRFLEQNGTARGIGVHIVSPVCLGGVPVSSERIRQAVREGDLVRVNRQLGAPYFVNGTVVSGASLGKKLGYPTANLKVHPHKLLPPGVFAVRGTWGRRVLKGMANVGTKPTVSSGLEKLSLEVHFFGFSGNVRGSQIRVEFLQRIRSEKKFSSVEALQRQLKRDEGKAKDIFRRRGKASV